MEENKKNLLLMVAVFAILMTLGITYAYFSANLTGGEDTTTINVTGGTMNIVYSGGPDIMIADIIPGDKPITTKVFTVTGNNTTDVEMYYKISLVIDSNNFSEEALKYKLISTNTDNSGDTVESINNLTNIGTGSKTIVLGTGFFDVPTGGDKIHTYSLEIYFPDTNANQNIDQDKKIEAHIITENDTPPI